MLAITGSPPHVREKLLVLKILLRLIRITPACAGKTAFLPQCRLTLRDHPRMCGKNSIGNLRLFTPKGSPPHVREKLVCDDSDTLCHRITPACAGKTSRYSYSYQHIGDHPRMCGKNTAKQSEKLELEGSPPHVREKLFVTFVLCLKLRITPACAGKTMIARLPPIAARDHPRMCGKN